MKTKCSLPKRFSGTRRVSGILVGLLLLALIAAPGTSAAPFAYFSNLSSNTMTVIDGTTVLTPAAGLAVGAQPSGVAVNPAGTRVYVANSNVFDTGVASVSVIDTASLAVLATITTGITGQPSGVAVSEDGSLVYVASSNGTVAVIDAATNTVANTLSPPPGQIRQLAAIVVAGGSVYATDIFTGEVVNVTDSTMPRLFVSFDMMGLAAGPSGSRLYVSYGDASDGNLKIGIIDVATSFTQQSFTSVQISTSGMDSGFDPAGIAVSPSGAFVYAAVLNENKLAVMNTATNAVSPITVGLAPFGVAVDPMGTRVYVGNIASKTATVLDATTNTVMQPSVALGKNPMAFGSFVASERPAPPPPQFLLTLATVGAGTVAAQPASATGKYDAGTVVTLTATPDAGFQFASWSGACSGSGACSVTMDAAKSVTATFTAQYTLFLTTIGSGTIAPQPAPVAGKYAAGTVVSLTATPDPGFLFTSWSGACSGSNATCSVTMDAVKSVTATFTAQYTLFLTAIGNGTIGAQPAPAAGKYAAGTVVTLTVTPAAGSVFTSWSGACSGSSTTCSVTMDAAKSVTATFTAQYVLTLTATGNGTITAAPSPVAGKYNAGTVVTLTAMPGSGSRLGGWSGACSGSNATCSVTMDAAKSVTATFTTPPPPPAQFTLTLTTVGDGTVAPQPAPLTPAANATLLAQSAPVVGKYNAGTVVTLTPKPAAGCQFSGWSGACSGSGACSVTMNAAKSVTATFTVTPPPPTICDDKISDLRKKVAAFKHPWWHDHQLKGALKMYSESLVELGRAKAKVGGSDKRFVHAQKQFDAGKAALCSGHYWRAHHEFWETYVIAHEILKQNRR